MATTSELNALDHSIYSAINRIRGQNKRADHLFWRLILLMAEYIL